jgi:O-antigen/teichoic acid export membrane protein
MGMQPIEQHDDGGVSNRDVAKGAGTTLLARLGGVLDVVIQPLYVWLFGLAGYGFYGALWAAVNLLENVSDLGMTAALQRVVPQAGGAQGQAWALRSAFLLGLIPCITVAAIVSYFAEPVASLLNASARDAGNMTFAVRLFIWALPLWAFVEISTSALRSKRVFGAEIRLRLLWEQLIRLALVLSLYAGGVRTMALLYAHMVSLSLICILCIRMLSQHFDLRLMFVGPIRNAVFAETLKAGLGVLPVNIVTRLLTDGPSLALNALLPGASGAVATSLYIIARKIASVVQLVRTAFAYVLAPLASSASTVSKDQVQSIYGFATRLSLALALPLGAILAAMGPSLLPLFGKGAETALLALILLIVARVIEAIVGAATPIQQVTSAHMDQQLGSLVGLGVAALTAWSLPPSLNGMTLAVMLGLIIASALPMIQLLIGSDLHPYAPPFGSVLLRTLGIAGTGLLVTLAMEVVLAPYLPAIVRVLLSFPILIATLWSALRFALPIDDRQALGPNTVRRLKLS